MIPPDIALREGHAAELGGPDEEGVLQQSAGLEVLQQGGGGLIHLVGDEGEFLGNVAVVVPVLGAAAVSAPHLHEAHPALDHAAGHQATPREVAAVVLIDSVEFAGGLALAVDVQQSRGGQLEPGGQLVAFDAGLQPAIAGAPGGMAGVELGEEGESVAPALAGDVGGAGRRFEVGDRFGSGRAHDEALVVGREEAVGEGAASVVGIAAPIGQGHEGGDILVDRAEGVGDPGAHAGKAGKRETGGLEVGGRAVHVRLGGHGHEEGHLVDVPGEVGKGTADPAAGLSVLRPLKRALHEVAGRAHAGLDPHAFPGVERLAVQFLEGGLVVEEVALAGPAIHEELDDPLCPGCELGEGLRRLCEKAILREKGRQRHPAQAGAEVAEEVATGGGGWVHHLVGNR